MVRCSRVRLVSSVVQAKLLDCCYGFMSKFSVDIGLKGLRAGYPFPAAEFSEGLSWAMGAPLVGCRLKCSHLVGSQLKFLIFVGSRLKFSVFVCCR